MRQIKMKATREDCQQLTDRLSNQMLKAMEVLEIVNLADEIVTLETDLGIRYTDREIVLAWTAAANDVCDSAIDNANAKDSCENNEEMRAGQVAYWESQRPSTKRLRELKKFAGK